MPWKEIKKIDLADIAQFVTTQQSCSEYYQKNVTVADSVSKFDRPTLSSLRAFIYRDSDYELNLAMSLKDPATAHIRVVGVGKIKDLDTGVSMLCAKVKQTLGEMGITKAYAIYTDDVYPETYKFYDAVAHGFDKNGFKNTIIIQPRDHTYSLTTEVL